MSGYYDSVVSSRPAVGDTKISVIASDHNGWLICDGRELPIADYRGLFSVIGYQFGGEGSIFKLPDPAGRVPGIAGSADDLTQRNIGDIVGEETHTLDISEIPQHNHTNSSNATGISINSAGEHSHTSNAVGGQGNLGLVTADGSDTVTSIDQSTGELNVWTTPYALTINSDGSHSHPITDPTHTHTISNTGGSQPHNNMQPTMFIGNLFIYKGLPKYGVSLAAGYSWF